MDVKFRRLTEATAEIVEYLQRWENDPTLIPFIRPNKDQVALERKDTLTVNDLERRLEHQQIYLIYLQDQLVGEMDYQIDPKILFKKENGTAWLGIILGEEIARGRGIGYLALQYLENEIKQQGLQRIELGVFEFNTNAVRLYQKLGYKEIARIPDFTYWQNKMWLDIRMEKYLPWRTGPTK